MMKGIIEILVEIDRDSFSYYPLIWGCQMMPSSSGLPNDMALPMPMFLHNLVPIIFFGKTVVTVKVGESQP